MLLRQDSHTAIECDKTEEQEVLLAQVHPGELFGSNLEPSPSCYVGYLLFVISAQNSGSDMDGTCIQIPVPEPKKSIPFLTSCMSLYELFNFFEPWFPDL